MAWYHRIATFLNYSFTLTRAGAAPDAEAVVSWERQWRRENAPRAGGGSSPGA